MISQSISDMVAGSMWQVSALPSDASIGSDSVSSSFSHASFSRSTRPEKGDFQDRFRSYWHHASLLANGCGSAALLAELEGDMASQAAGFGRHFAVAQQVRRKFSSDRTLHDNSPILFSVNLPLSLSFPVSLPPSLVLQ